MNKKAVAGIAAIAVTMTLAVAVSESSDGPSLAHP